MGNSVRLGLAVRQQRVQTSEETSSNNQLNSSYVLDFRLLKNKNPKRFTAECCRQPGHRRSKVTGDDSPVMVEHYIRMERSGKGEEVRRKEVTQTAYWTKFREKM